MQGDYTHTQYTYTQQPMVFNQQLAVSKYIVFQPEQEIIYGQPVISHQGVDNVATNTGFLKNRGWERIQDREGIFIKQKLDIAEAMTRCQEGNTFYVYPLGKDGKKKGKKLFKAKEKSNFFAQQCMTGSCRPFQLQLKLDDDDERLDGESFLVLDRPCKCTCLCFNRPEISVTCVEDGKDEHIGKVKHIWQCCGISLELYDNNGNLKYLVQASCLQWGVHCRKQCCCEVVDFDIKSPSGEIVSTLHKKGVDCAKSIISKADNFSVLFPQNATKEDKALIMSSVLLLDYRYFE